MIAEVASKFPFAKILKISKMKKNGDIKDVLIVALPMILSLSLSEINDWYSGSSSLFLLHCRLLKPLNSLSSSFCT